LIKKSGKNVFPQKISTVLNIHNYKKCFSSIKSSMISEGQRETED